MTNEVGNKPLGEHSAEELEHLKLVGEVEKLRAENSALNNPLHRPEVVNDIETPIPGN